MRHLIRLILILLCGWIMAASVAIFGCSYYLSNEVKTTEDISLSIPQVKCTGEPFVLYYQNEE